MQQLKFQDIDLPETQAKIKHLIEEFEAVCKGTTRELDRKEFSAAVDKAYTTVSDFLNSNQSSTPYPLYALVGVAVTDPDLFRETILAFLSKICKSKPPVKEQERTKEEEIKLLRKILRDHNLSDFYKDLL